MSCVVAFSCVFSFILIPSLLVYSCGTLISIVCVRFTGRSSLSSRHRSCSLALVWHLCRHRSLLRAGGCAALILFAPSARRAGSISICCRSCSSHRCLTRMFCGCCSAGSNSRARVDSLASHAAYVSSTHTPRARLFNALASLVWRLRSSHFLSFAHLFMTTLVASCAARRAARASAPLCLCDFPHPTTGVHVVRWACFAPKTLARIVTLRA